MKSSRSGDHVAAAFALTLVAACAAYQAVDARFIALKHRFQSVAT